ncbi:Hypothetical Protein FCC1311_079022 [Hondaea fermentalgiana]|uniref:Uncharacterized protein n=1 Tax=Hondaea fermentalgiana TaxID=2315210 RepID=A0A2R5GLC2_9STRA|nr:Hypothetical Protein FCC1311_079022 [Hondaea fermentalgiana]|eukprot:GBG31677.1 Hypothetical Protein FCC1311_079022 [Hondaea fermentalgiana]
MDRVRFDYRLKLERRSSLDDRERHLAGGRNSGTQAKDVDGKTLRCTCLDEFEYALSGSARAGAGLGIGGGGGGGGGGKMDERTFLQLLSKFEKVRDRDFRGKSCKEYSLAEARAYRAKVKAEQDAAAAKPQNRGAGKAAQALADGDGFFEAVQAEMRAAGVKNVPEVVDEMREGYLDWLCQYNLEDLENLLAVGKAEDVH